MDEVDLLLASHQIRQCLLRYPVALDSRDFALLESLFTPDARIDIPAAGVFDPAGYRTASQAGLARLDATHHFVNDPVLRIEGEKGSAESNRVKVGKVKRTQIREIAELKMKDLNAVDLEGAMRQIEGTARNMGIVVED